MEKPTCEVMQDLLPSYCDGVTCDSVSEMLREHLEGCMRCRCKYQEIKLQREQEFREEISKGQKFKEKLKGLRYYMIGIVIGFLGPIVCLALWLLYICYMV
ncbi:MAG: zf-HC2 domain-containing protein [Lachnospiraceae bacterium]|nr:zf-HC2 domain-containing protein [Lachnospiraceae bacterium]